MALTRPFVIAAAVVVVAGMGFVYVRSGSSTPPADVVGTSGEAAAVAVSMSSMFVTVENRAGMAIRDVKVTIVPVGRATVFAAAMVPRIDTNSKRVMSLGEFRGRDGTPLNMRIHRPQSVSISAERVDGKAVQVEVPWKLD